ALIQDCRKTLRRGTNGKHQTKQNSSKQRNPKREQKHIQIDGNRRSILANPRDTPGIDGQQEPNARKSKNESKHSASERHNQTLGEQLTNDMPASSSKRRARNELALTSRSPNEKEISNVGTGNQQHKSDGAQ